MAGIRTTDRLKVSQVCEVQAASGYLNVREDAEIG